MNVWLNALETFHSETWKWINADDKLENRFPDSQNVKWHRLETRFIQNMHSLPNIYRHSQWVGQRAVPLKIYEKLVILCSEKWRPKQKYCCLPKVKYFAPKNFGLATPLLPSYLFSSHLPIFHKIFDSGDVFCTFFLLGFRRMKNERVARNFN